MGVLDLKSKESLDEDAAMRETIKKFCTDCKTTKTPLWRGGPAGPKTLCNACGIKYKKKRRAILGLNKGSENKKVKWHSSSSSSTITTSSASTPTTNNIAVDDNDDDDMKPSGKFSELCEPLKIRLIALGSEVLLQRSSSSLTWMVKKQRCQRRRKLGEEEENAAVSLMALSYGLVFA
ncbi:GATA transcription factor 15-like [Hibiscus syriacus]|uniref:GATA transcription factor 15-like n=1 Tax=Hibiscus syriacus TaxID=106335 RepID=UPI001923F922|nr:GATA transcription factor 15-like [Hibiscus syriacus]